MMSIMHQARRQHCVCDGLVIGLNQRAKMTAVQPCFTLVFACSQKPKLTIANV